MIGALKLGRNIEKEVPLYSANNKIDAISKEVGTDFQVVIGFGYFKSKKIKLDFIENSIEFIIPILAIGTQVLT